MFRASESVHAGFVKTVENGKLELAKNYVSKFPHYFPRDCAVLNQALHIAAYKNHTDIAVWLLSLGANADLIIPSADNRRTSLLQHLVIQGRYDMAAAILPYVRNINYTNAKGKTALHYATYKNNAKMFSLLLQFDANCFSTGNNVDGVLIDPPIAAIVKDGNIELAKLMSARYPHAIADIMMSCPNLITFICRFSSATHDKKEAMVKHLVTEFPETFMYGKFELIKEENLEEMSNNDQFASFSESTKALCVSRRNVNAFLLALNAKDNTFINKRLVKALDFVSHLDNQLLATDLFKVLENKHPIINTDAFYTTFREMLFISSPNPKLYTRFGKILVSVCDQLLASDKAAREETTILCKLTLLLLSHTISHGKEEVYQDIANLLSKLDPAINLPERNVNLYGKDLFKQMIAENVEAVRKTIAELKAFYSQLLNVRLTDVQVNPCSAIETMIDKAVINKLTLQNLSRALQIVQYKKAQDETMTAQANVEASNMLQQFAKEALVAEITRLTSLLEKSKVENAELSKKFDDLEEDFYNSPIIRIESTTEISANNKSERDEQDDLLEADQPTVKRHKFFDKPAAAPAPVAGNRSARRRSARK